MRKPFLYNYFYFIEKRVLAKNYKFSNNNDIVFGWIDFNKKICDEWIYHK